MSSRLYATNVAHSISFFLPNRSPRRRIRPHSKCRAVRKRVLSTVVGPILEFFKSFQKRVDDAGSSFHV